MSRPPEVVRLNHFLVCRECSTRVKPFIVDQSKVGWLIIQCPSCLAEFAMTHAEIARSE